MIERFIVIGAGAVGGSLGALLHEAGSPTVFVARGPHGASIRSNGLSLLLPERSLDQHVECVEHVSQVAWRPGDIALLATKLQDAEAVLDELLAVAGTHVPVVCLTNGMQAELWAQARFQNVLSTVVWVPATHLIPGEVRLHSTGSLGTLDTGPVCGVQAPGLADSLCERLRSAGLDAIARDDIRSWKVAKWVTNLGGAAQALVTDDWERVAVAARAEGEAVLTAAAVDRIPTAVFLERVKAVGLAPVDGRMREGGSTWQSRARGKPLESAWIEGAMAELAIRTAVPAPVNARLADAALVNQSLTAAEALGD